MNLYVGCSGWSYEGWKGTFYPSYLENKKWLSYYSKYFKFVEVDSTFYSIPSRLVVKGWKDKTPDNFKFHKVPKSNYTWAKTRGVSKYLYPFFYALEPLMDKNLILLIQTSPILSAEKGFIILSENVMKRLDNRLRYAIEVRESTWFNKKSI